MPPTHPNQAGRLEAVETESFEFLNELALAFRRGEKHARPQYTPVLEGIRKVLSHLTATGRLIPAGGMALTAEQVEDVRTAREALRGYRNFDGNARLYVNRLVAVIDALFPATEPAECEFRCDEGIARAGVGVRCPACTAAIRDKEATEAAEDGCSYESFEGGRKLQCVLPRGHECFHDFVQPAPAEPAEEETKAEEKLVAHRDSKGDIYVGHALVAFKHRSYEQIRRWFNEAHPGGISERRYRAVLHLLNVEASSPVVPAPTETGPWPSLLAVPVTVQKVKDAKGYEWHRRGSTDGWRGCNGADAYTPNCRKGHPDCAPFVAAEEG